MPKFKKQNQNGFSQIFILIILVIGLIVTYYIVNYTQTNLKPKAYSAFPEDQGIERRQFENKVGWAYTAVPGVTREEMIKDMQKMKDLGMNIVYIGHANPADIIETDGFEPGLAPVVYFSIRDEDSSSIDAKLIYQAVLDSIEASKEVGLDVVLPVGYQIKMGKDWNNKNPEHLRVDKNGNKMNHWSSGETASPYSPKYLSDIREYYEWVNQNFISKYPNIVAINLGDEPMGSDFSEWAKDEFAKRYNIDFDSSAAEKRGEFLSEVLADHAANMSNMWREINPEVWTMMTFHIQREQPWLPNMESLFRKTPSNFVVSADTHLHDDLPTKPLTDSEVEHLYGLVRTLSYLSKVYDKRLMLWTSANVWGLTNKGGIEDAERNFDIVKQATEQGGGKVAMVMAWGWNIKDQGVYRCYGQCLFDTEDMLTVLSSKMGTIRDNLSTQSNNSPDKVVYLPSSVLNTKIGEENIDHLASRYVDLRKYNLSSENIVYLNDGLALRKAREAGAEIINALE